MDFIFECFYEDTFQKITRSGLHDRNSRRDVLDHLNAVIGGCSDGQNVRTDEVARLAVLAAVKYHREKKCANSEVCMMGKYHNILYIALRTCWEWGVRDSAVVVVLLEEIYSCEKTFERLFLGALFGPNAPHFIAGWRSDFRDQDENTRAMVYFLEHATSLGLELPVFINSYDEEKMLKFIDIPIESCGKSSPLRVALQASAPDILMILLRFGAEPLPPDGGKSTVISLLDKLMEKERRYTYQLVSCLHILLRNIALIEMPYKAFIFEERKSIFLEKYGNLFLDNIIKTEQVFGVMSLKHLCRWLRVRLEELATPSFERHRSASVIYETGEETKISIPIAAVGCRCRIRDLLRLNSQLPGGIDTLKLPRRLQRYVDLMEE